jgi:hypothetical protein
MPAQLVRNTFVVALLSSLAGCAPTLHGGGDAERWRTDSSTCHRETAAFSLIPDFGATKDFRMNKCMKERQWVRTVGGSLRASSTARRRQRYSGNFFVPWPSLLQALGCSERSSTH